jgi:membrane protein implicated in regulation of membrane protease activity
MDVAPEGALSIPYEVTQEDLFEFFLWHAWRRQGLRSFLRVATPGVLAVALMAAVLSTGAGGLRWDASSWALLGAPALLVVVMSVLLQRRAFQRLAERVDQTQREDGRHVGVLTFSSQGISESARGRMRKVAWPAIREVASTRRSLVFLVGPKEAILLPRASVPLPSVLKSLEGHVARWRKAAQ